MKSLNLLCLTLVLAFFAYANAQEAEKLELKDAEAKQAIEAFDIAIEEAKSRFADAVGVATEKYNAEVEVLRKKQVELLESIQKKIVQSNDLDEAIKIRAVAKSTREMKIELPDLGKQLAQAEMKIAQLQKQISDLTVAKNMDRKSKPVNPVVGTWRWFDGMDTVVSANGKAVHAPSLHGKWRSAEGNKNTFFIEWQNGSIDTVNISEDGQLLEGTASLAPKRVWAVRLK
jgi:hypothetical protein